MGYEDTLWNFLEASTISYLILFFSRIPVFSKWQPRRQRRKGTIPRLGTPDIRVGPVGVTSLLGSFPVSEN